MGLRIQLKPGERIILGDCVVTNHKQGTRLLIEGNVPILREKDIMTLKQADSPTKRIYYAIQLMYTSKQPRDLYALYLQLARQVMDAAPSMRPFIDNINNLILEGQLYKALKESRKLIAYERRLVDHTLRQPSLSAIGEESGGDGERAVESRRKIAGG